MVTVVGRSLPVLLVASALATARNARAEAGASGADEIIEDPAAPKPAVAPPPPLIEPDTTLRLVLFSRMATQTSWDDLEGVKDVLEWWSTAIVSARRSGARLSWQVGARFEFLARANHDGDDLQLGAGAYSFGAEPWEVYADYAVVPCLRVRVGNQVIAWGKLDVASAGDMLGALDLRHGFAPNIDDFRIPTPSITLAWFPEGWLQVDVGYTPFFTPDRFDVAGTNYALIGPNVPLSRDLATRLRGQLSASTYTALTDALGRVNAPDARPQNGEAAARITWHAGLADLGLSGGVLRSKVPLMSVAPALTQILQARSAADLLAAAQTAQSGARLLLADYSQYVQTAFDVVAPIGPVIVAAEAGYTPARALPAVDPSNPVPGRLVTALGQLGAKLTYAPSLETQLTAEASYFQAVETPDPTPRYLFFDGRGRFGIGMIGARKELGQHVFELTGLGTLSGPSLTILGRYSYRVCHGCALGVGGAAYFGASTFDWSFGSLQHGLNQVFVDFRWEL
jgi:hypothetical protein